MVYREVSYFGEGKKALERRLEEIELRKEKIISFEIKTCEM